jgi:hypothetical protein
MRVLRKNTVNCLDLGVNPVTLEVRAVTPKIMQCTVLNLQMLHIETCLITVS